MIYSLLYKDASVHPIAEERRGIKLPIRDLLYFYNFYFAYTYILLS